MFSGSSSWSRGTADGPTLVTGIDGFVGSHLADLLVSSGTEAHGTVRHPQPPLPLPPSVRCHRVDLLDRRRVQELVAEVRPAAVYHLAALSSVADSWQDPATTLINNVGGEANLLDAIVKLPSMPRVLVVGSTDEYGEPEQSAAALSEDTPLRPLTPYGVSKVAQDLLGLQYHLSHHLPVVRVRPFNHTGPRQSPHFAVPSFCQQIARIEAGKEEPILHVGNLDVTRDFSDVRDVVIAYRTALERGLPGEVYNIGSGKGTSLRAVVDILLRMSKVPIRVEVDRSRARSREARSYVADITRFHALTGWTPRFPLEQTLADTLDYWRTQELHPN